MLLLFGDLGERPLDRRTYRRMAGALAALGPGAAEAGELTEQELERLGLSPAERETVLGRLALGEALDRHLERLWQMGIAAVTRVSPGYPRRLRAALGDGAPMVLYCAGDLGLFETACVSLVGSRRLRQPGRAFAQALGTAAAAQGFTCVSGGAAGADTVGIEQTLRRGGRGIVFLADSLRRRLGEEEKNVRSGRLLLVSEYGADQSFSTARAFSRNRLIHAMGQKVFVAQSDYGRGGTWNGVMENLKAGWSPCFICDAEPEDPGTRGLVERGCVPVGAEQLGDLRLLSGNQTSLYETEGP